MLLSCYSGSKADSNNSLAQNKSAKIIEVQEFGGCYCSSGVDLRQINVIPTIEVAYAVALPILQCIYKKNFEEHMPFNGYLLNDSVWVIYGTNPQALEGGYPYIEIDKHDGRVLKITHTK